MQVGLLAVLRDVETRALVGCDARSGMTRPMTLSRMKLTTPL